VEDECDGVPDPVVWLLRAEIVEYENLGVEDWLKQLKLSDFDLAVVAVLNLLEELAVVAEEAFDAALTDQPLEDAGGEVCLPYPDGADEEQAAIGGVDGPFFGVVQSSAVGR